jgi:quercetin dioxygenase-like cupin family protein
MLIPTLQKASPACTSTGDMHVSVAHVRSPAGRSEPGQRPEFDEFALVLEGSVRVEHGGGVVEVRAGQAVWANKGE